MTVALDRDISGDGTDSLAAFALAYAVIHLTAIGPEVTPVYPSNDYALRYGFFTFGNTLNVIGATNRSYWRPPIFINFPDVMWTPDPSTSAGSPLTLLADLFRWHLSPGTTGHVYVFSI